MPAPFGPLLVGPYAPDLPDYANPGSLLALNVIPAALSYRPFPSFASATGAAGAAIASPNDFTAWTLTRINAFGAGSVADTSATTDPQGGNTAEYIQEDTTVSATHRANITNLAISPQGRVTGVLYAKAAERTKIAFQIADTAFAGSIGSGTVDLTTGTTVGAFNGGTGSGAAVEIEDVGDGWWKITVSGIPSTTDTQSQFQINILDASGNSSYSGTGTSGLYVWGAQLSGDRIQGAFYARKSDGSSVVFAGDASRLYKLNGLTWEDVSRTVGGAYNCTQDNYWQFAQFGPLVIAINGSDVAQKFNIETSTDFEALGGTPPASPKFIMVVGDFVVLGHTVNGNTFIEWSGINDAESWTPSATTLADQQQLPDGGRIMGLGGGEYGIIVQERAIRRMSFIGSPLVFQFDKIHEAVGSAIDYAVAVAPGGRVFFIDRAGPYALQGDQLIPIGAQKVDRSFWNHATYGINQLYLGRTTLAINPVEKLLAISIVSAVTTDGDPDTIWLYQWEIDRWSIAQPGDHEMITSLVTQDSLTLEEIGELYSSLEAVPASLDSYTWTGAARQVFGAFVNHTLGYFDGLPLEATVDTTEGNIAPGRKTELQWARAITDASTATIAIGRRNDLSDSVSWGSAKSKNAANGLCGNFRSNGRYQRGRVVIPADTAWTHLQGITDIQAVSRGMR